MSRGYYEREAARSASESRATPSDAARRNRDAGEFLSETMREVWLFRKLLAETDATLRRAYAAGRLPDGVIPADLVERTRAALAGETKPPPVTVDEAIALALQRLTLPSTSKGLT